MKYPIGEKVVEAVYDTDFPDNPFLSAMPRVLSKDDFMTAIRSLPPIPHTLTQMSPEERRQILSLLSTVFIPFDYMYIIYDQLYRAIRETYSTKTTIDRIRQINLLFIGKESTPYATQAVSGSVLGVPGIGKTSTVRRALATLPQVIKHSECYGKQFFCKQVLFLHIECPSDCSTKTLALNLVAALDRAIGSNYLHQLTSLRSAATSALATQIKVLCMTHNIGLLLVDEIQNVVETAQRNRQTKPLLKFLVELVNDTSTAVFFIGTPMAEQLFTSQEHLKRRTRGVRLLPLRPDGTYRYFLEQLWPYQFTPTSAPLTDKLANKLFDFSGGVPAYISKIFQETQVQALLQGQPQINEKIMQKAIDLLAIKIPKTFSGGTYISDFSFGADVSSDFEKGVTSPLSVISNSNDDNTLYSVPRMYANKRGRPSIQRDNDDLLLAFKNGLDLLGHLQACELLEVFGGC